MEKIRPAKLKEGATIGIVATSGAVEDKEAVARGVKFFETRGYKVVLADNCFESYRYLAGADERRVEGIHKFFSNPEIDAIICIRGGFGSIRLVDKIDYSIIRDNPKIFCGYSDVSALSAMFLKHAGLITYSGPMLQGDFGAENVSQFTIDNFFKVVTSDNLEFEGPKVIGNKTGAEGIVWGGNLATIVSLCGQDFIPDEPFIFFVEDLNERIYRIDKMFTQLFNIEKFRKNVRGIVLGDFLDIDDCGNNAVYQAFDPSAPQPHKWLDELWEEIAQKHQIPITGGFKITHLDDKITVPYGAMAKLDGTRLTINY